MSTYAKLQFIISKIMTARPKNNGTKGVNTTIAGYGCTKYILVTVYFFMENLYI